MACLPIGLPIVAFGVPGLAFYILNAVLFAFLQVIYTVNVIEPITCLSDTVKRVKNTEIIRRLSHFDSRPVMFRLTTVITIVAIVVSVLLMPVLALPAALLSMVSLFLTPLLWLLSFFGMVCFLPSVIVSAILFVLDMSVWIAEALSLIVQRSMPENSAFRYGKNATQPFYLTMDQLIIKYVVFCAALGLLQIAEGCVFLMTFFASPLGLIKMAFGAALLLIALFGAVITDGRIFGYLYAYIARPVIEKIRVAPAEHGCAKESSVASGFSAMLYEIDSPCILGPGAMFISIVTGLLEACGEALAVLAVVPVGLSAGMIALSLLPFVSVLLFDLFMTSLMWLPAGLALGALLLIRALYSEGRCSIMR